MGKIRLGIKYYSEVLSAAIRGSWGVLDRVVAWIGTLTFLVVAFNRQLGTYVTDELLGGGWQWSGFSPWWSLLPILALFVFRALKANLDKIGEYGVAVLEAKEEAAQARRELEAHFKPLLRPRVLQTMATMDGPNTRVTVVAMVTNEGADGSVISWRVRFVSPKFQEEVNVVHPLGVHYTINENMQVDCSSFLFDKFAEIIPRARTVGGRFCVYLAGDRRKELDDGAILEITLTDHMGRSAIIGTVPKERGGGATPILLPGERPITPQPPSAPGTSPASPPSEPPA